jgi:hypothetical protein
MSARGVRTTRNARRAERAQVALDAYQRVDGVPEDEREAVADLLVDLLHLADRLGDEVGAGPPRAAALTERACLHHAAEVERGA